MAKQFSGFTQDQTEILARKMGFKGPMGEFHNFLRSDPANSQKFSAYETKAKQMVESAQDKRGFSSGGVVSNSDGTYYKQTTEDTQAAADNTTTAETAPDTTAPYKGAAIVDSSGKVVTSFAAPNENSTGAQTTQEMFDNPDKFVTDVNVTKMNTGTGTMISDEGKVVDANPDVKAATVTDTSTAATPTVTAAPKVTTSTVSGDVKAATENMTAAHGTVSADSQVVAAEAQPSDNATVQGQLDKLMKQFDGGNTPAWAAGAMRMANSVMAARGLGASSMAGSAVTQAAMESAISIAAQDADTFSKFELTNLNNRQQARLQNAQAFLTMDVENLNNDQQMAMFKSQSVIQGLFTDTAAENATKQFNATSQAQTDQFFASLKTQVAQFNAAQKNGMKQFNAGEKNQVNMFNRQMADARDQFNASNRLLIDQSNATWRRTVTTTNNENANEANRINAQVANGLTTAAYNNMMLREQDAYTFAFQAGENAQQRNHEIVVNKINTKDSNKNALWTAAGRFIGNAATNVFGD